MMARSIYPGSSGYNLKVRTYLCFTILMVLFGSAVAMADSVPDEIIIKFKPVKTSSIIAFEKVNQLNDMPLSYRTVLKALDVKELKPLYKQKTSDLIDQVNKKIFSQSLSPTLTKLDLKRINRIQRYLENKAQSGDDRAFLIKVQPGSNIDQIIKQLEKQPEVESVQKNIIYQTFATPNDPLYLSNQRTAFKAMNFENNLPNLGGWDISTGNGNVIVAVLDTGFKVDHPELVGQFWVNPNEIAGNGINDDTDPDNTFIDDINGWNFWDDNNVLFNNTCANDVGSHGTRVSSIIGAITNNGDTMAGVNWRAKIMALRVFSSTCSGSTAQIIHALDYAMMMGADVINMSFGGTGNDPSFESKCQDAYSAGIVLVASMGNNPSPGISSKDTLVYPAAYPTVIGVGSVSQTLQPSVFSVRGLNSFTTELVAVGENMCVARNDDGVVCNSAGTGTSFSAPVVAGLASLLLTKEPTLTPLQLRTRLQNTATDIYTTGYDIDTGYGVINAYNALTNTATTVSVQSSHLDHLRHYPNPTSGPEITFVFSLDQPASEVTLRIFDLRGRLLIQKSLGAGTIGKNTSPYDLKVNGQKLAIGTYVYQIEAVVNGKKTRQIERFSVI